MKKVLFVVSLLIAATAGAASVDEAPFSALRFGAACTTPAKWPAMRTALAKNRAAFDEVWFSTGTSFPKLAWHEEHARQCAAAAADLRALGIAPSIELQTVIGHTDGILSAGDCSGRDWGTWVGADGTVSANVACPADPRLAAYFARVAELHAAWRPASMWIDDDVTLRNRAPMPDRSKALLGCFCDRCLAGFAAAEGKVWPREALATAIRAQDPVGARWEAHQCANFAALCRTIAAAAHRVSPETVFGYQYGNTGRPAIVKGIYDGCGRPVRLRPGDFAYWDANAYDQIDKAYVLQRLSEMMGHPDWIGARCPEIESCPRTFACRTPQSVIVEAFANLALGMDFLSMFIAAGNTDESVAFYADELFPRLAASHDFLKAYRDAAAGARPCGFTVPSGRPKPLVACRGVPIVGASGVSLGMLPDVSEIPVYYSGAKSVPPAEYPTFVMKVASSVALTNWYARCEAAAGGRLPFVFERAVRAFAVPHVRADGTFATLGLINASIDRQEPVSVRLTGVPPTAREALWHQPEQPPQRLPIRRDGTVARVTLPRLGAWECGFLSLSEARVIADISYAPEQGAACSGDLHLPERVDGRTQLALLIHGGGWTAMDRQAVEGIADFFVKDLGFAVFNIDYRLASEKTPWPACGDDCVAAARFALGEAFAARCGFRPKKLWIFGGSAGGHLALWTGLTLPAEEVAGIVSISGIADPGPDAKAHPDRYRALFGGRQPTAADFDSMSVMKLIRPGGPKILLTHECQDDVVPIASARPFLRAYRSCGNEIGLFEYSRNAYKGLSGHCIWIPGSRPHRLLPKIEREIASFVQPPVVPAPSASVTGRR